MRGHGGLVTAVAMVAACGRVGFDDARSTAGDGALGGDARVDGAGDGKPSDAFVAPRCGGGATAPDPLAISGTVIYFTNFLGSNEPIGSAAVAFYSATGVPLAQTTSDGSGTFAVELPTGGKPINPFVTLAKLNYFDITTYNDLPVDQAITGAQTAIIDDGAMSSVYSAASISRDTAKGTIALFAKDCAGSAVAGVTIDVTPAPEAIGYADVNGQPTGSATALPSGNVASYNAVVTADTHIAVSRDGTLQFTLTGIGVASGDTETVVLVHLE